MNKFLLAFAAAAFVAGTAGAQVSLRGHQGGKFQPQTSQFAKPQAGPRVALDNVKKVQRATRADNDRDPKAISYVIDNTEGLLLLPLWTSDPTGGLVSTYYVTNYYPAEMIQRFAGNQVSDIVFYAPFNTLSNPEVFILNGYGQEVWSASVPEVNMPTLTTEGYNVSGTVVSCDYTVTGQEGGLYIGYRGGFGSMPSNIDPYEGSYPNAVVVCGITNNSGASDNGLMILGEYNGQLVGIGSMAGPWSNSSTGASFYAQAAVEAYTTGEGGLQQLDAEATQSGTVRGDVKATVANGKASFSNWGLAPITSLNYKYEANGQTKEGFVEFNSPVVFCASGDFNYQAPLASSANSSVGTLTITKVNTADDTYASDNSVSNKVLSIENGYRRMPVVEEVTATGCGWCPRGIVGLGLIEEEMGEHAVVIAAHPWETFGSFTDALYSPTYANVADAYGLSSAPLAMLNRETAVDPYYGSTNSTQAGILDEVKAMREQVGEANLTLATSWNSGLKTSINATTTIDFGVDVAAGDYSVLYVVTEDGLTGVDQLNYYASYSASQLGITDDANLSPLCDEKGQVEGTSSGLTIYSYQPTFNHTARYITDAIGTSEASLLPACAAGESVTHTLELRVADMGTFAQAINKNNLKLAALLVDNTNGVVVTGSQVAIGETGMPSAIENVNNDNAAQISVADGAFNVTAHNAKAEVYTTDGKLVSSASVNGTASLPTFGQGVYVIRVVENGHVTTKKAVF